MGRRDLELVGLRLWLQDEKARKQRVEISILLARRLRRIGLFGEAKHVLHSALAEAPGEPRLQRSMGLEAFRDGDVADGLALYDKGRWRLPGFEKYRRPFDAPVWQGEPLKGKRLLVWAEQGIGDQIMQSRILAKLLALGARVTLESDIRLHGLLKLRNRIDCVQQFNVPDPSLAAQQFDVQTSMLSAWRYVSDPLSGGEAIEADRDLAARYRAAWTRMGAARNVGLSWHSKASETGAERSIDPALLRPLSRMKGLRFHSLQYGDVDLKSVGEAFGAPILQDPESDPLQDLRRQAAQIAAMDLVISIDNATVHLAGALGTPCWVLLPKGSEWRWGTPDKPLALYPSVRLFRADDTDDWSAALWRLFDAAQTEAPTPRLPAGQST